MLESKQKKSNIGKVNSKRLYAISAKMAAATHKHNQAVHCGNRKRKISTMKGREG